MKTQDGYSSLSAFSAAQGVELTYNDQGQLTDRGTPEGAQPIMSLLVDDWGYPVVAAELNPNDPLVNTASEYMYQMATVAYHTLHSTQEVILTEDVEYNGELFTAGTYDSQLTAAIGQTLIECIPSKAPRAAWRGPAWPIRALQRAPVPA